MFVILSKLLPPLIYPLGLAIVLLAVALALKRRAAWRRAFIALALLALWAASNSWVAYGLTRSLEWRYLPPPEMPSAEAIVLLGGQANSPSYPRTTVEFDSSADRIIYAAWLYRQGKADHILLSGGRIQWLSKGNPAAEDMAAFMNMMGVPREALWLETASRNTYENAAFSREILDKNGINRILLVTSAFHMPRSVAIFEKQGFDVIPAPSDYTVTQDDWEQLLRPNLASQIYNLLPSVENLSMTTTCMKEYIGMFVYRLRGWL
jgi:uncharacterized SAM-binding protein YcdF (DUF218 family)